MGNISVSLPADGTTADVADVNTPITTIVNEFNGNIDNTNIKSGAAIATAKLADDAGITAAKLGTSAVLSAKLGLSSGFTGGVTTYTNPGSAGGTSTFFYVNLGGIKMFWGATASQTIGGAAPATAAVSITFPAGFFTTIQSATATPGPISATQYGGLSTSTLSTTAWSINFYITVGTAGVFNANVFVVGT